MMSPSPSLLPTSEWKETGAWKWKREKKGGRRLKYFRHKTFINLIAKVWRHRLEEEDKDDEEWKTVFKMFRTGYVENCCLRCQKTVYPTDKIGPLKDFTFFHSGCFRCVECSTKLTLKTYFNNQVRGNRTIVQSWSSLVEGGEGLYLLKW